MSTPQQMGFVAPQPPPGELLPEDGREELARGLLLMRASQMNLVRFQLAMERRDRAVALETVDELVAIDGRLRDFLQDMPAPDGPFADLTGEVERQRASLVKEKLTLVAGKIGPRLKADQPEWTEPPAPDPSPGEDILELVIEADPGRRWPSRLWIGLALLAIIACCLALGIWAGIEGELPAFMPA